MSALFVFRWPVGDIAALGLACCLAENDLVDVVGGACRGIFSSPRDSWLLYMTLFLESLGSNEQRSLRLDEEGVQLALRACETLLARCADPPGPLGVACGRVALALRGVQ